MKFKILVLLGMVVIATAAISAEGIQFDSHGKIIAPDIKYLEKGIDAQAAGYEGDAMRYLKKSARFGNAYSQAVIGLMYLKNKDYISTLSWFKLIDLKMIPNNDMIEVMMAELENKLTDSEKESVNLLFTALNDKYGKHAALKHREKWQKSLSFGGSHVKGHVPSGLKIHVSGGVEQGSGGAYKLMGSGMTINSFNLKQQLYEFVYEYELKFINGEVQLKDFELLDDDQSI